MTINGVRCEGLVSDLHPDRHQLVSYSYKVDGKIFYGERQSRIPNSAFKTLHAGDSVVVFYNRAKPEESLLGDPIQILKSETFAVVLGGVMAATFVSGIVMWRRNKVLRKGAAVRG
jgi:hypothetical protein